MGTITNRIADAIIHGHKEELIDETKFIITYNNMFDGSLTYAIIGWRDPDFKYHDSPACSNTKFIWKHPSIAVFPERN